MVGQGQPTKSDNAKIVAQKRRFCAHTNLIKRDDACQINKEGIMPNQAYASADNSNRVLADFSNRIIEIETLDQAPDTAMVDTRQAATFLGLCPETLEVWRSTRKVVLPYMKFGRAVRYLVGDLRKFRDECRIT